MVWIHGGGFIIGASVELPGTGRFFESKMARKGCVCVSLNYRLGMLGFGKVEGGDYNCGIWDQVRLSTTVS